MKTNSLLLTTGLFAAFTFGVKADSLKEVTIDFTASTQDIHVQMAGTPTGDPRSADLKKVTPDYSQQNIQGEYDAGWTSPPGAGSYKFTFNRAIAGDWNLKYILTTTGIVKYNFDPKLATSVADLSTNFFSGGTAVVADNTSGTQDVDFTDIVATIVTGLGTFDPQDWDAATGSTYSLPDLLVAAGASGSLVGDIPSLGSNQWVKISYDANGVAGQDGYTATPEPGTTSMFVLGLLALCLTIKKFSKDTGDVIT